MTNGIHILLVDDDDVSNYIISDLVESAQEITHLEVCDNGKCAYDYLERIIVQGDTALLPHIILLDVNMPVMSGLDFLEAYRKFPAEVRTARIVLMLSTELNKDENERLQNSSDLISSYIEKPLNKEALSMLVNQHLEKN